MSADASALPDFPAALQAIIENVQPSKHSFLLHGGGNACVSFWIA